MHVPTTSFTVSLPTKQIRLDISCRNLWSPLAKALIDVRIFNPQAESNWNKSVQQMYNS